MTQSRPSDSVPVRERFRVKREPKQLAFDVAAHCGPECNHVMLNTYENEHSYFMTTTEALQLSEALRDAALLTTEAPEYERAPWLPAEAE